LNGHIFQGSGKHSYALLPFLCIADAQNILELMSSVACQRYVWGISEPAIGFLSRPSGAVMELVLSWVDQSTVGTLVLEMSTHQFTAFSACCSHSPQY
jgi:hypothetical protein